MVAASAAQAQRTGDFDGDGFADLAIGVPGEKIAGERGAGVVNVIYGRGNGLSSRDEQIWSQDSFLIPDDPERDDGFGSVLCIGDFDGDGKDDLAIGVPGEDDGRRDDVGAVHVIYGSDGGLNAFGTQIFKPGVNDVPGTNTVGAQFGYALAAGDFNNDGFDDLAIGMPGYMHGTKRNAGAIVVLYGSFFGLKNDDTAALWHQNKDDIEGVAQRNARFGEALAAGNFNIETSPDDLAIGIPGYTVDGVEGAGAVLVMYGKFTGLDGVGDQFWHQDSQVGANHMADFCEEDDGFGATLAVGDFDKDTFPDLAIGVPGENFPEIGGDGFENSGGVHVIYGSSLKLTLADNQFFTQASNGIGGTQEDNAMFGAALAVGDFDDDRRFDLAIGAPGTTVGPDSSAGAVYVIHGSNNGLQSSRSQTWTQDSPGIAEVAEESDNFGAALASWDFDNDGFWDLAIGVPGENTNDKVRSGAVHILYGSDGDGLTNAGDQLWTQDSRGISGKAAPNDAFGAALGR